MKKKPVKRGKAGTREPNRYPKGWDRKRVEALAAYYDSQSDEEAIAEIEAAFKDGATALIQVPIKLVPEVQKLISRRAG
jgi:hypothetical protein